MLTKQNCFSRENNPNSEEALALRMPCHLCGKSLANAGTLRSHIRIVHEGKKKSRTCKDCGESFGCSTTMYKHRKLVHGFVSDTVRRKGPRKL